jgi:hypothetical protein
VKIIVKEGPADSLGRTASERGAFSGLSASAFWAGRTLHEATRDGLDEIFVGQDTLLKLTLVRLPSKTNRLERAASSEIASARVFPWRDDLRDHRV